MPSNCNPLKVSDRRSCKVICQAANSRIFGVGWESKSQPLHQTKQKGGAMMGGGGGGGWCCGRMWRGIQTHIPLKHSTTNWTTVISISSNWKVHVQALSMICQTKGNGNAIFMPWLYWWHYFSLQIIFMFPLWTCSTVWSHHGLVFLCHNPAEQSTKLLMEARPHSHGVIHELRSILHEQWVTCCLYNVKTWWARLLVSLLTYPQTK